MPPELAAWISSRLRGNIRELEGALNRLCVLAEGTSITLFANEAVLTTLSDDTFAGGQIGLAAGTFTEAGLEVSFDNFSFWDLAGN